MTGLARKNLTLPDGEVSYLEGAADAPLLHFAHATGFNAQTYASLLTPLQGRFRVAACDQRGHGFTTLPAVPGDGADWHQFGADLARILDRLDPKAPAVLAGHSMGAITSLMVAANHPERVRGLVLIEPVLMPRFVPALMWVRRLFRQKPPPGLAEMAAKRRAIFPSFEMALASYRGRGAFKTWAQATVADYLQGGLIPTGNGTEMRLACEPLWESSVFQHAPPGIARLAGKVRCPLTLIHAEVSNTTRPPQVARIRRLKPDARIVQVPGTTHFLPMERPDVVQDEIARMLR